MHRAWLLQTLHKPLIESGIPIAKARCNKYSAIQLQNLNNKQQTTLQNATVSAQMDKANLKCKKTGAVNNAQSPF